METDCATREDTDASQAGKLTRKHNINIFNNRTLFPTLAEVEYFSLFYLFASFIFVKK